VKRSELHSAIWARPISAVAHDWGLSDTWLRKVCRTYNVPVPPRGYWQRVHAGHDVRPLALPAGSDVDIGLTRQPQTPGEIAANDRSTQAQATKAIARGPLQASTSDRSSRPRSVEFALEMVLLERDAQNVLRHRAMEQLLVDLTAILAAAPNLNPEDWREWVFRMQAEVQQRLPRCDIVEWAMKRFSVEKQRSR
jgi:hypothetical protein